MDEKRVMTIVSIHLIVQVIIYAIFLHIQAEVIKNIEDFELYQFPLFQLQAFSVLASIITAILSVLYKSYTWRLNVLIVFLISLCNIALEILNRHVF